MVPSLLRSARFLPACLPFSLVAGCATFNTDLTLLGKKSESKAAEDMAMRAAMASQYPTATVVMQRPGKPPVEAPYPLTEPTYVQQVLERTGLRKKFRRMKIELVRTTPMGPHRLEVHYDRVEKRVASAFDYEVRPGDRLVVTEDNSTLLDDMLENITMPFGG